MAWYNKPIIIPVGSTITGKEEVFEASTLSPDRIKDIAKYLGVNARQDKDGTWVAIPNELINNPLIMSKVNKNANFIDYWLGKNPESGRIENDRMARYGSYVQMDSIMGESILALDVYADEILGVGFIEDPLEIIMEDTVARKWLVDILNKNNIISELRSISRNLCKWGDLGFHISIPEKKRDNIDDLRITIYTPNRWEARIPVMSKIPISYLFKKAGELNLPTGYKRKTEMKPWELVQISIYDEEFKPYGRPLLESLRVPFDQLSTIEALLALSRASKVERLIIKAKLPTANPTAALTQLNALKSMWKNMLFDDDSVGRRSYARPHALTDILWAPMDSFEIDRLNSSIDISSTDDAEYFRDKAIMLTRIPKGVMLADQVTDRGSALAQQDLIFARAIIPPQRSVADGIAKLCTVLLAYKGYDIDNHKVQVKLRKPPQISGQLLEQYSAIADTAGRLISTIQDALGSGGEEKPVIDKNKYIALLFKLGMPKDIVSFLGFGDDITIIGSDGKKEDPVSLEEHITISNYEKSSDFRSYYSSMNIVEGIASDIFGE